MPTIFRAFIRFSLLIAPLALLAPRGSRLEAAAFLSHSQTKSVSARSFVQDSGARSVFDCSARKGRAISRRSRSN
jgi:hypothetical protein